MKTRAFLLALPVLAAAACTTDKRPDMEIYAVCSTTDDCTFTNKCSLGFMGEPTIDASQTSFLWVPVEVHNALQDNGNAGTGRLNTNDAHVDTVVLAYSGAFGTVSYHTNQLVPTNGSAVIGVDLVPGFLNAQAALQAYAGTAGFRTLDVNLRLKGYRDDGSRFETGDFPIAIGVCTGCIPACPTGTTIACYQTYQYPRSCK